MKKKRGCMKSPNTIRPVGEPEPNQLFHLPAIQPPHPPHPSAAVDDSDETSPLTQLRGQLTSLILFCLTWMSALCVISRPFRHSLAYDQLIASLLYALFSASAGLHTLVFYLMTRNDVSAYCCSTKPKKIHRNDGNPTAVITHPEAPEGSVIPVQRLVTPVIIPFFFFNFN